jgi:RNA polymerase sigma-70 factor (ECF subfamily)
MLRTPTDVLETAPMPTARWTAPSGEVAHAPANAREVIAAYGPLAGRALRYLGVAEADLEDACQEVFLVVCQRLDDFENRSKIETWLYGICRRVAANHRRSTARRREAPMADPPEVSIPAEQHDALELRDARHRLQHVLEALDEDKRAVFVLYEIERLPMADVAEAVGCPLQTAYTRLHAARDLVMKALRRLHAEDQR